MTLHLVNNKYNNQYKLLYWFNTLISIYKYVIINMINNFIWLSLHVDDINTNWNCLNYVYIIVMWIGLNVNHSHPYAVHIWINIYFYLNINISVCIIIHNRARYNHYSIIHWRICILQSLHMAIYCVIYIYYTRVT